MTMTVSYSKNSSLLFPIPATPARTPTASERHVQVLLESIDNRRALQAFAQTLVKSQRQHPDTLANFLALELRDRPESVIRAYRDVVLTVGSVMPSAVATILDALVNKLGAWDDGGINGEDDLPAEKEIHDETMLSAIVALIKLTPSSSSFLLPAIDHHFPFHQRSLAEHLPFIRNILRLADLQPNWRAGILELILSRALVIDVELQNDADLLRLFDAAEEVALTEGEDEMTLFGLLGMDEDDADKIHMLAEKRRRRRVKEGILKLDSILNLVFTHIQQFIFPNPDPDTTADLLPFTGLDNERSQRAAEEMFSLMLAVFEKSILPTFKSRYLQFLPFYMASMCPTLADQFLGLLFRPLVRFCSGLDAGRHSQPTTTLLLSVAYIGSFVARARFLSVDLLTLAFELLVDLSARLRIRLLRSAVLSPGILPVMALQHVLYIFVWQHPRLRQCMSDEQLATTFTLLLPDMAVLRHCNPEVVAEFMQLAGEQLGLLDGDLIDEYLGEFGESTKREEMVQRKRKSPVSQYEDLETYFPFDPLLCLSLCRMYITSNMYQEYPPSVQGCESSDDDSVSQDLGKDETTDQSHSYGPIDDDSTSSLFQDTTCEDNNFRIDCSVDSRRPSL